MGQLSFSNLEVFMRFLSSLVFAAFFVLSAGVQASSNVKVGIVNIAVLLEQAPQAQAAGANLEKEFASQQAELSKLGKKIEQQQTDLQKNAMAMSESQVATKEREITMLARDLQRKRDDVQELINIRRNEELNKLQNIVNQAIRQVGEQGSYDLILYEGIAYSNKQVDLTDKVLAELKKLASK